MNLEPLEASRIDDSFKGVPPGVRPFELGRIRQFEWNVLAEDLPLPVAVIKTSALEHNRSWMRRFLKVTGAQLYPHGKTTMSPQLFALQLEDGARGITLATAHQLAVARRFGVHRVLLANQLIAPSAVDYIARELHIDEDFELLCLVDSVESVEILASASRRFGLNRPIEVLLEVGAARGRCGVRSLEDARQVAQAVERAGEGLQLRGVEGFEGIIAGGSIEETETAIRSYLDFLCQVATTGCNEGWIDPQSLLVSAGGSAFFDLVVEASERHGFATPPEVILRSGCYLTHDSVGYRDLHERLRSRCERAEDLGEGLRSSLEVWAHVQSRPEPTRAVLTMGRRDCSYDIHLPLLTQWFRPGEHELPEPIPAGHRIEALNDQHALVELPPDSPLRVGDMVASGISHPCTTFDKWQLIHLVDDEYNVTDAIRTFF
ncbi:amino acid deaminase [Candidatus Laterigemmans baculatus]|uniref:amino acid deaminase n=1 Tax=Candidatus Laterigemmans baculatus TaxID=2770505 RepID=UPI0013DBAB5A|nr:amino acid deaminase [Candidatus Laterigemmans baculatus]